MRTIGLLLCWLPLAAAAEFKVGLASAVITPAEPIYLSGYASRNHPFEGVAQDLKAKAMAIEDRKGARVVIVTTDLIGLPRNIAELVAARAQKTYGLERARLLLNSSHTHAGPVVGANLNIMFDMKPSETEAAARYGVKLADDLVTLVGAAIGALAPAEIGLAHGEARFAVNRREPTPKGMRIGVNPSGPTDTDVPVLRVKDASGRMIALLFGYACHNTTLGGDYYRVNGDYAGYAQTEIEKTHPGVTAMFLMLCGADQNPNPRGTPELAHRHGAALAAEVTRVAGAARPLRGPLRAAFQIVEIPFAHHTRETFEARLEDKNPIRVRHARAMLKTYDERAPIRRYPYPVQAIAFGKDAVIVALGGEVVVDYPLRIKKEFAGRDVIVAGYSNDVMSYIPSLRVLREGGYEADDSMIYYGQPGPYGEEVEERVFGAIRQVMRRVYR